jgi:hypothetical protein
MITAASLSFKEMSFLLQQIPSYRNYRTAEEAGEAERIFRRALGLMLKDCGDELLSVAERRTNLLTREQHAQIDELIDRIGAIFARLDREGAVCLVGDCEATIAELEEIDARLILLVEEAISSVYALIASSDSTQWFQSQAPLLNRDLWAFGEAAEERNHLLGLGWESEFAWPHRRSQHG